jgi:antitoxin component of MazEF toxin-antitoxin module
MIKSLQPHGNSQAIVIDKPLMEILGITAETRLHLSVHGNTLIIRPVETGFGEEEIARRLKKLRPRYKKMLDNLAK